MWDVGLNHMPWWHFDHYYDLHSEHNFYIKLDDKTIFQRKCNREIEKLFNGREKLIEFLMEKNIKYNFDGLNHDCNFKTMKKENLKWNTDYKKQGYKLLDNKEIFKEVSHIVKQYLK